MVSFGYETNGKVYIHLDDTSKEIGSAIKAGHNASRGKRRIKKYATENTEDTEKSSLNSLNSLTYPHGFNDRWHNIRVFMDNVYDRITVILDGKLVFESIPRSPMAYFLPALSFAVRPGNATEVEIDNVSVSGFYALEESINGNPSSYPGPYALGSRPPFTFITLFNEDFEQLKKKNGIENTGWRTKSEQALSRI